MKKQTITQEDIDNINELIVGERIYDYYLMSEQNLGNIIIQTENGTNLINRNKISSSDFKPIIDNEEVFIFTNNHDDEILDITDKHNKTEPSKKKKHIQSDPTKELFNSSINKFYFASLTVIGLYIVFRMIKKTK
jgi:hypothetical protein